MSNSAIEHAPAFALVASAARRRRRLFPYLLIAPSVVLLVAVTIFPLFFALKNSFYFWNLQMGPEPLGLHRLRQLPDGADQLLSSWRRWSIPLSLTRVRHGA